jgi:siroheme synthase-like protein
MTSPQQPHRAQQGYLPINVKIADRPVLVVGGGRTALVETRRLMEFGARVDIVAPNMVAELAELGVTHGHRVTLSRRPFSVEDEDQMQSRHWSLVFACSGQADQDDYVAKLANDAGVLACLPDNHEPVNAASFYVPAIRKRGLLRIAVGTEGYSSALAKALLERIEASLGGRIDKYMLVAEEIKSRIAALDANESLTENDRRQILHRLSQSEEVILAFQRENFEEALQLVDMVINESRDPATI